MHEAVTTYLGMIRPRGLLGCNPFPSSFIHSRHTQSNYTRDRISLNPRVILPIDNHDFLSTVTVLNT
jgi:hypothetical protein